ncbi:MAG TPA: ABC transporter substrate-binding protein [Massilibacterium sp.]|nr:ABC transporter substrate-binding protein [Massilibacterium sp.]
MSALLLTGCGNKEEKGADNGDKSDYTIGVTQFVEHPSLDAAYKGFQKALEEEGLNVTYKEENAQGDMNNSQTIATNLVGENVDLIFANATPSAQAAVNATSDIPIVFTSVTDAVGAKLVDSMEKPGGNATGTVDMHPDAIPKTMQFISKEMDAKKVGMIYNAGEQNSVAQVEVAKKEAKKESIEIVERSVAVSSEVQTAVESLVGKVDVFYIITDNTVVSAMESVVGVAEEKDIPLFVGELDSVERGGFAAYGFSYEDIGYQSGKMAAKILKDGKKPEEIPVEYPSNLKLMMNKKAEKEMNIEHKKEWDEMAELLE